MSVCVFRELTKTIRVRCLFSLDPLSSFANAKRAHKKKPHAPSTSTSSAHVSSSSSNPSASFRARFAACASSASSHSAVGERGGEREEGGRVSGASRRNACGRVTGFAATRTRRAVTFFFDAFFPGRGDARCFFPLRDVQKLSGHHRRKRRRLDLMHHQSLSVVRTFSFAGPPRRRRASRQGLEDVLARRGHRDAPVVHHRQAVHFVLQHHARGLGDVRAGAHADGRRAHRLAHRVRARVRLPSRRTSARTARQPPGRCRRTRRAGRGVVPATCARRGRPAPNRASACARGRT